MSKSPKGRNRWPWTRLWQMPGTIERASPPSRLGTGRDSAPQSPGSAADQPVGPAVPISTEDIDLLARLVRAEAQGEPYEGQVAVAAVVLNRLQSPVFPNTIRSIIYQPRQFEPVRNGQIEGPADEIHFRAVQAALAGSDPTDGAVFFYNPRGTTSAYMHSMPVAARIGRHVFGRQLS